MKVPPLFMMFLVGLPSLAAGQGSIADTVTYTGSFADLNNGSSLTEADFGANAAFAAYSVVTGIPKFDPSLGTLIGIRVSASYDYSADASFEIGSVINPLDDWYAGVDSFPFDAGINMAKTSEPGTHYVLSETTQYFQAAYYIYTGGYGDYSGEGGFHDFSDGESEIISWIDYADFVGSGEVEVLKGAIYVPAEGNFDSNNVNGLSLDTYAEISNGSVKVSYDYVAVPEPGALIMGLGGLVLLGNRHRSRA